MSDVKINMLHAEKNQFIEYNCELSQQYDSVNNINVNNQTTTVEHPINLK